MLPLQAEKLRQTRPPQKGPFQDEFFTESGHFWPPTTPSQDKHLIYGIWVE